MIFTLLLAIAFWLGLAMTVACSGVIVFVIACLVYDWWCERDRRERTLDDDLDRIFGHPASPAPVFIAGDGRFPLLHLDRGMGRTLADIQGLDEVWS